MKDIGADLQSRYRNVGFHKEAHLTRRPLQEGRSYLPLGIDVSGLKCLVVGGGRIGTRKALKLLEVGASVTILSPVLADCLASLVADGIVLWICGDYEPSCLDGFFLVIAATSCPALNIEIGRDAERRRALACVVSSGPHSRIIFPATHAQDGIILAVHSNGRDCSQSKKIRDELVKIFHAKRHPLPRLGFFGINRSDLPSDVYKTLKRLALSVAPIDFPFDEVLILATCQRWECYYTAISPRTAMRNLIQTVQDLCGVGLGRYASAFHTGCDNGAFHHLLRVASGLDSSLIGEREIIGQIRSAVKHYLKTQSSTLRPVFTACLSSQKIVRRESGLSVQKRNWADATVSLLEDRMYGIRGRRAVLLGCGHLGEAIALRLLEKGTTVLPLSRRAGTPGVPWCSRSGLTVYGPEELDTLLSGSDVVVLTTEITVAQGKLIRGHIKRGSPVVVDLAGNQHELSKETSCPWYLGLDEVAKTQLSGKEAAQIASAEMHSFEHTLQWHSGTNITTAPIQRISVGARAGKVSQVQVVEVLGLLKIVVPGIPFTLATVEVPCDRNKQTPLSEVGDDDFFTRDLDIALLRGEIDIAVHSAKDIPVKIRDGLCVVAVTPSFAPWECLVARDCRTLIELPPGATVGVSSKYRRQRLRELRPDLAPRDIRGNIPARLAQLDADKYDALILAAAGLIRSGLQHRISQVFSLREFPPAPSQGAVAMVIRREDTDLRRLLEPMNLVEKAGLPWA